MLITKNIYVCNEKDEEDILNIFSKFLIDSKNTVSDIWKSSTASEGDFVDFLLSKDIGKKFYALPLIIDKEENVDYILNDFIKNICKKKIYKPQTNVLFLFNYKAAGDGVHWTAVVAGGTNELRVYEPAGSGLKNRHIEGVNKLIQIMTTNKSIIDSLEGCGFTVPSIFNIYRDVCIKQNETTECGWKIMKSITRDIKNKIL